MDTAALYFDFYERGLAFEERDDARLFCLLTEGLSALSELGEIMLSDRLRQISVRPAPKLSVRATVKSNLLDVELGASGLSAADLAVYLDSYKRHQTFARLTSGDIIRLDEGTRAAFGLAEDLGVDAVDLLDGVSLPRRAPCSSTACSHARRRSRPIATLRSAVPSSAWTRSARWTLRCRHRSRQRCAATRSTDTSGSARSNTWALAASWPTTWAWAKRSR